MNSSQLEDWFTDIESTADLTHESHTKLAQAKSKGLTHTLISEALSSDNSWDKIKDLLRLELCNSDIHMSISHFMEIQQKDTESLAAYIHRFKRKAKQCHFHNDPATIRLFLKGLKHAHTIATHIYIKNSPQTLADAITDIEKLQAAQQLRATLLPSSMVNMMSSKDHKCFQCQATGNMACYCPRIRCFDCDEYGHVAADCPNKIPPSGTPAHHHQSHMSRANRLRSTSRHSPWDRQRFSQSRSHSHSFCHRSHSHKSFHRCYSQSTHWHPYWSTSHHCQSSSRCYHHDMPHRRSLSSHKSTSAHSRDQSHDRHRTSHRPSKVSSHPHRTPKHHEVRCKRVTIDDPPSDHLSSEDSSDSDEALN